ncbi:MAG: glycerol kinase, partial [Nitrospirae bacterium]|nr:glycerol kinase [Nitrospirota bacterium]
HVDGGAARNGFLCQFQSDILGIPVVRAEELEMTARGAALAAGLTSGIWSGPNEARALPHSETRFTPRMSDDEREYLLTQWARAVERAKEWEI